jgi:hypothetical protein
MDVSAQLQAPAKQLPIPIVKEAGSGHYREKKNVLLPSVRDDGTEMFPALCIVSNPRSSLGAHGRY